MDSLQAWLVMLCLHAERGTLHAYYTKWLVCIFCDSIRSLHLMLATCSTGGAVCYGRGRPTAVPNMSVSSLA